MADAAPLMEARQVSYLIPIRRGLFFPRQVGSLRAVDAVSLDVRPRETVSIVGKSGAGKSTLSLLMAGLLQPTEGEILFRGQAVSEMDRRDSRGLRRQIQIIFQNPFASLNPGLRVGRSLELPLRNFTSGGRQSRRDRVAELLAMVGLRADHALRYPHEFSGGQAQRLSIARALAAEPDFLVLDEAVSALDVSIQAQIVNLLTDLQHRLGLAYLFVAHDLGVVHHISDRVGVMFHGRLVEFGPREDVFAAPRHPHTMALLAAALSVERIGTASRLPGLVQNDSEDLGEHTEGCSYRFRCPFKVDQCSHATPEPVDMGRGHLVACHVAQRSPADWLASSLSGSNAATPSKPPKNSTTTGESSHAPERYASQE